MGVASYFSEEKGVELYDREFCEYLKSRARPETAAALIVER